MKVSRDSSPRLNPLASVLVPARVPDVKKMKNYFAVVQLDASDIRNGQHVPALKFVNRTHTYTGPLTKGWIGKLTFTT